MGALVTHMGSLLRCGLKEVYPGGLIPEDLNVGLSRQRKGKKPFLGRENSMCKITDDKEECATSGNCKHFSIAEAYRVFDDL